MFVGDRWNFYSRVSVVGANQSVELRYIDFGTINDLTAKSDLADEAPIPE